MVSLSIPFGYTANCARGDSRFEETVERGIASDDCEARAKKVT